MSLEEARGFFEYIIVLDAVNSRRRQSSDITVHVPFNKTSINVTGLNPQLTYTLTIRIAVQNERGEVIEGPTSIPIKILSYGKCYSIIAMLYQQLCIVISPATGAINVSKSSNTELVFSLAGTSAILFIVNVIIIIIVLIVIFLKRKKRSQSFETRPQEE